MSETEYPNVGDTHVAHEGQVDEAVDAQMERTSSHAAIADVAAPSGTYVQAEAAAMRAAINGILATLRDAELLPLT